MVIEYARQMLHLKRANLARIRRADARPGNPYDGAQKDVAQKGGTMRLGAYPCNLRSGSLALSLYRRRENLGTSSPSL